MKKAFQAILVSIALLSLVVPAYGADVMGVDIHGFISQGYLQTSDNNFMGDTEDGTFEFNEIGLNFSTMPIDNLRLGLQLFSRDLGNYGNNDVTLDWAYGDYRWRDWLGVRVGKIKTPHGLYNESRDVDMVRNWVFLPQSVYPEIERDTALSLNGAGLYGSLGLGRFGTLSYQAMVGTQNIDANESLAQSLMGINIVDPYVVNQEINVDKKYAFSLTYDTPLPGLRIGGTFQYAEMDLASTFAYPAGAGPFGPFYFPNDPYGGTYQIDMTSENYVASAEYTWNDLMVVAEYTWANRDVGIGYQGEYPDAMITNLFTGQPEQWVRNNPSQGTTPYRSEGWYLGATYRFTDWFELGAYYSEYYPNRNDKDGSTPDALGRYTDPASRAWNKDLCLTTRFDINENWIVKLEAHTIDGVALLPLTENVDSNNQHTFEDDWNMFAIKVTYSF